MGNYAKDFRKENFSEENSWNRFRGIPNSKGGNIESIKFSTFCFTVLDAMAVFLNSLMKSDKLMQQIKYLEMDKRSLGSYLNRKESDDNMKEVRIKHYKKI